MKTLWRSRVICVATLVFWLYLPISASAQSTPNVPDKYKRLFFYYSDQRKWYEKALNSINLTSIPVGRSFALIAGVTQYPNFQLVERSLKPAQVDIEKLKSYLKDQEFFDEIVVLKDGDMTLENLDYFLDNYFPKRAAASPHSRFLFAYSGHGYAEGDAEAARGFLLTSAATSLTDPENRIDLRVVRTFLEPVIDSAEKVLVLVNACQSGAFLGRKSFGPNPLGPGDRGAYAIMASRANQRSWQLDKIGPGSVFFEKIFAGLEGAADSAPRDGVVTYHELDTYLHSEVPYVTNGSQIPMEGDISRNGSIGEFFFLNRGRQVTLGNVKAWNPGNAAMFGVAASDELERGRKAFGAKEFARAFQAFTAAASAGNSQAMTYLGYLHERGQGVKQDYTEARQWYERAAAADDGAAMRSLGFLYDTGHGVKQDYVQARQWYESAVEAGDVAAMNMLAILYETGQGVARDEGQARQWYEKAAAAGDISAMYNLGLSYDRSFSKEDYAEAARWYKKAAAAGSIGAMDKLGYMYAKGRGVEEDLVQSRRWYEKAADAGDPDAKEQLKAFTK